MSHFLEHLPSLNHVRKAIESAAEVASEFLFIQGPFFDADDALAAIGLKFYWSDWSGHTCHLTTAQLKNTLDSLGLSNYELMFVDPVSTSDDPVIHPLESTRNQHDYDSNLHAEKPQHVFWPCLFREFLCLVNVGVADGWEDFVLNVSETRRAVSANLVEVVQPPLNSEANLSRANSLERRRIDKVAVLLLLRRRWHYLSYLHLRDAVRRSGDLETAFIFTENSGLDGVALALEFPRTRFHFATHRGEGERFRKAREIAGEWALQNVCFEEYSGGEFPDEGDFGLVGLCDVLHVSDDPQKLVDRACRLAQHRIYATAPLVTRCHPSNDAQQSVVGFSLSEFEDLLPNGTVRGHFWRHRGYEFRRRLERLTDDQVREASCRLMDEAAADIIDAVPIGRCEALGISLLSEPDLGVRPQETRLL
jgi:hypothetical protein